MGAKNINHWSVRLASSDAGYESRLNKTHKLKNTIAFYLNIRDYSETGCSETITLNCWEKVFALFSKVLHSILFPGSRESPRLWFLCVNGSVTSVGIN